MTNDSQDETAETGLDGGAEVPPSPSIRDLYGIPLFPESFAAFLRLHPALWRIRRVDRFGPLDLDLVDHHVSVQGLIDAEMLNAFLHRQKATLDLPDIEARAGDPLTLYVPAMSAPKRLLLNFSARSEVDQPLPVVSRTEGSRIVARDILARLLDRQAADYPGLQPKSVGPLLTLISTLAFSNPHRLAERLEQWRGRSHRPKRDRGLHPHDLEAWISREAEDFLRHSGPVLAKAIREQIERAKRGDGLAVPKAQRPDGLRYFPTLRSLALHDIQDVMKNVVQAADPWPPPSHDDGFPNGTPVDSNPGSQPVDATPQPVDATPQPVDATPQPVDNRLDDRVTLAGDAGALVARVAEVLGALDTLDELMSMQVDQSANEELYYHLDRWTAYAVTDVQLGIPFVLKFSQTLPLIGWRRLQTRWWWRPFTWLDEKRRLGYTIHLYPLSPQDALSVHAEVFVDDPQLRLDHHSEIVHRNAETWRRQRVELVFGHELRPTGRLLHRYSSRRPESHRLSDPIYLRIHLKILRSLQRGYFFSAVAFLLGGLYTAWTVVSALSHHRVLDKPEPLLTIAALAVTLSLWLTAMQHPRAIVYRKLWIARRCFYVALLLILVPLALYGWRQSEPTWGFHWSAHELHRLLHQLGHAYSWTKDKLGIQ